MKSLAALGIAAYLLFVVAGMPASFLAERLQVATAGVVQLTDPQGTIWSGHARGRISPPRSAPIAIDRLAWSYRPARLFAGEIAFALQATSGSLAAQAQAARGFSGWRLYEASANADASALTTFVPILAAWRPAGAVTLSAPRLAWDERHLAGEMLLEWRKASSSLSDVVPLGSYKMQIKADAGQSRFAVSTLEGPLTIRGEGQVTVQGEGQLARPTAIAFSGEARPDAARAQALEPLLTLLGPKRPDGSHALDWRSR